MPVQRIAALDATRDLTRFDTVIDARSPAEFAEDHLPGAVNWPVLDDAERALVGTVHKQESALAARKLGAALAARRIADHIERELPARPRDWQPLVYCWRGGQRSGSLAWFLGQIGFRTQQLEGGYKAFRAVVRDDLASLPESLRLHVVAGRTGSGKTRLLQSLLREGAQVLDLEALACHRGSVLGALPDVAQPSQKAFDTHVWHALRAADPALPLFVESESLKIGRLRVPEALIARMRAHSPCHVIEMPDAARVQLLLEEYAFFFDDADGFAKLLEPLIEVRGQDTVRAWQAQARTGDWPALFADLMQQHYDPLYARSMQRNFRHLQAALPLQVADGDAPAMTAAARDLIARAS